MPNANLDYFADLIRRKTLRTAIIGGLFLGYMTATAGVAVFPGFAKLSSPFICEKDLKLESEHYSMVNSESGVNRHFYCEDTPGERKPVNLRVMIVTGLIYSVLFSAGLGVVFAAIRMASQ